MEPEEFVREFRAKISLPERVAIAGVMRKNATLMNRHNRKLIPLRAQIHRLKRTRITSDGDRYSLSPVQCCRTQEGRCVACVICRSSVCKACRKELGYDKKDSMICELCRKQLIYDYCSGDWITKLRIKHMDQKILQSSQWDLSANERFSQPIPSDQSDNAPKVTRLFKSDTSLPYYRSEPHIPVLFLDEYEISKHPRTDDKLEERETSRKVSVDQENAFFPKGESNKPDDKIDADEIASDSSSCYPGATLSACIDVNFKTREKGGELRIVLHDCKANDPFVNPKVAPLCQFLACTVPRTNAMVYKPTLTRDRLKKATLTLSIPIDTTDAANVVVHLSCWFLKPTDHPPQQHGPTCAEKSSIGCFEMAVVGEGVYTVSQLLQLDTNVTPLSMFKPVSLYPAVHSTGYLSLTMCLHSAAAVNRLLSSQSDGSDAGKLPINHGSKHKFSSTRTAICDHLCVELCKISALLLPPGSGPMQIYVKTQLLPIGKDAAKSKAFMIDGETAKGGTIQKLRWPSSSSKTRGGRLCCGDAPAAEISSGRCLQLIVIGKKPKASIFGSEMKVVLGVIRLGSNAFDCTAQEASIWNILMQNLDSPMKFTIQLRPNLNLLFDAFQ